MKFNNDKDQKPGCTIDWRFDAWPTTPIPTAQELRDVIERASDGDPPAALSAEAHSDRSFIMEMPNNASKGAKVRKQESRAECRRQAQLIFSGVPGKLCVVCDAITRWPAFSA